MEAIASRFSVPQRQSRVAIGVILIKFIRLTVRSLWPILLSFFVGGRDNDRFGMIIGYVAIGFAAFNLIGSVLTYFRFYFHIEDGAVIIDKGILRRTKTNIPFERIQTINFKQNILHQIFGVVSLEIDTAGAKKAEMTIDALKKEDAEALRSFILAEKAQIIAKEEKSNIEEAEIFEEEDDEVILHLTVPDLFKVGVSQNHLRSMGLLFAFVFSILNEITEDIPELVADELSTYNSELLNTGWVMFLITSILVIIISFIYSLVTTILGNYDLKLSIRQSGLKLVKGLLNREEISVNKKKVQIVSWSDNPIRMAFKMFTLQIAQASSAEVDQLKSKIRVPGSYQSQVDRVIKTVFPANYYREEPKHPVSILLKYRLFVFLGLLPTIAGLATYYFIEWQALFFLIWAAFIWLIISIYYRKRSFEVNDELLRNNRGTFGHHYELTQLYKIQSVEIKQSWYQRRKALATVSLYTAAGTVKIPFIRLDQAESLENFVLYRIESDKREWM